MCPEETDVALSISRNELRGLNILAQKGVEYKICLRVSSDVHALFFGTEHTMKNRLKIKQDNINIPSLSLRCVLLLVSK